MPAMPSSLVRDVKYPAIDGIRFYAAFAVFLQHVITGAIVGYFRIPADQFGYHSGPLWQRIAFYFTDGNHGVDVFFIISGFLMARIVLSGKARFDYPKFIGNRVRRIYPAFLVSLVIATLVECLLFGWAWKPVDFAKNLIFLNGIPGYPVFAYNHVSWSLGFEFAFYLMIPALLLLTRLVDQRIAAGLALAGAGLLIPDTFIRMKALFVGALIGAFSDQQLRSLARRVPLAVVLTLYLGCGVLKAVWFATYLDYYYWFLAVAALAFVKITMDQDNPLSKFFSGGPMRRLGTMSYSFYLYHSLIATAVLVYLTPQPPSLAAALWYGAFTFVLTLLVSWLSYQLVESRYFRLERYGFRPAKVAV